MQSALGVKESLSDLHLNRFTPHAFFAEAMQASAESQPDLLFLTGDTVHRPEGLDVAVVVRELLVAYRGRLVVGLVDRRDEAAVMPRFGVVVLPAVVYVRDGQATELVARMRDWPVFAT